MSRRSWMLLLLAADACASAGARATGAPSGPVRGLGPALVGTWELVSTRVTRGESTLLDEAPPTVRAVKILNGTHYSLAGAEERTYTFRIRLDGDRWVTDGGSGAERIHDVWRRVQ